MKEREIALDAEDCRDNSTRRPRPAAPAQSRRGRSTPGAILLDKRALTVASARTSVLKIFSFSNIAGFSAR